MSSYNEIMDRVRVDDAMRERVLAGIANQADSKPLVLRMRRTRIWLSAAAALVIVAIGIGAMNSGNIALPDFGGGTDAAQTASTADAGSGTGEDLDLEPGVLNVRECDSAEKLSQAAGFDIEQVKDLPFRPSETAYSFYENDGIAETVWYGKSDDDEICLRKARGDEDVSGDYNDYADETKLELGGAEATLKGNGGKYSLAIWRKDGFSYSLSSATPLPRGTWERMLASVG